MFTGDNKVINEIVDVVESSTKAEQKRMLYLLKVEKARSLARKLGKRKPTVKYTDDEITQIIHQAKYTAKIKVS